MTKLVVILAAIAAGLVAAAPAGASTTAIDGKCGMHRGRLTFRNSFHEQHRVKVGWMRTHHRHKCRGVYKRKASSPQLSGQWFAFDLRHWNWGGIVDVATKGSVTVGACTAFGTSLAAQLADAGSTTAVTVGALGGCVAASQSLYHARNDFALLRK